MAALDATFLNNATREYIVPGIRAQVYSDIVGFSKLRQKGKIGVATSTGIKFNVILKKHEAVGLLPAYDTLATQQINPTVQGTLTPALYYGVAGISEREVTLNTGGDQVKEFDMIKTQIDNCRATMQDNIGTDFYGSGTANPDGYIPLVGLGAIVGTGTYAGIAGATYTNWQSFVDSTTRTLATLQDPADAGYLSNIMYSAYYGKTLTVREQLPTDIITGIQVYQLYMNIMGDKYRIVNNTTADASFGGASFAGGSVTMSYDRHVPNGTSGASYGKMYFLNFNRFMLMVYPGKDFDMQDPGWVKTVSPATQLARFEFAGQIYCDTRNEQSVINDIQHI
jgi:hypothetical protein